MSLMKGMLDLNAMAEAGGKREYEHSVYLHLYLIYVPRILLQPISQNKHWYDFAKARICWNFTFDMF